MTKYSSEFKVKLVNEYFDRQISILGLSKKYGMPSKSPIYRWVHEAEANGLNYFIKSLAMHQIFLLNLSANQNYWYLLFK
ncbi:putative transposase [Lactobacillus paragasseri]|jgi:transposase-like protein|nr:putative transposase [Lactobacillus paragasseri]